MVRKGRILIVDDEKDIRVLIREILEDEGYDVADVPHSEAACAHIASHGMPDLVVLDIWLENSDRDGMEILADLKKRDQALPVLMISGHGNIEMAVGAIKLGAYDFIEKPFNTDRLLHLVARALEAGQLKRDGGRNVIRFHSDVPDMQGAIKLAAKAASGDGRVMVTGPKGGGRNHLAQWIHQESGRGALAFISVRAAGLDVVALERAVGKVGAGTLVLRDVADLPVDTQKQLLRMVANKTDYRLIVTACSDFALQQNDFLPDLYERLAVNVIDVPGLNGRRADIEGLACAFIRDYLRKWGQGDEAITLDDTARAFLQSHRFGGHMAELQALCSMAAFRMMQDGAGQLVTGAFFENGDTGSVDVQVQQWLGCDLRLAREGFERWYFDHLAERFDGNISAMASFAGMDRTALHRKLKSLKDGDEQKVAS